MLSFCRSSLGLGASLGASLGARLGARLGASRGARLGAGLGRLALLVDGALNFEAGGEGGADAGKFALGVHLGGEDAGARGVGEDGGAAGREHLGVDLALVAIGQGQLARGGHRLFEDIENAGHGCRGGQDGGEEGQDGGDGGEVHFGNVCCCCCLFLLLLLFWSWFWSRELKTDLGGCSRY